MRKFLISVALISATAIAVPASAQGRYDQGRYDQSRHDQGRYDQGYRHGGEQIHRQINQIENRIHRAVERRQINRNEANRLLRQANQIERLSFRYSRNGLSQREHHELQNRVQNLRQQLRWERQEDRRRWR